MLIIVSTHPIQYQVPIWRALAADGRVPFEVWYLTDFGVEPSRDPEFGTTFRWDIDTMSGYPYRILRAAEGAVPANFWKCRSTENLREMLRKAGATAVWIQGWQVAGYWQAAFAAKAAGAAVWLRAESNDLAPTPPWKRVLKRLILGRLFSVVDHFLYIGQGNRRLYRSFGVRESQLRPAPYAIDNARFATQADALRDERAELRRKWGVADNALCVLFCGKFIAKKRPMDLVRAAQALMADNRLPEIHLLFVGAGELGEELRQSCDVVYDADAPQGGATARAPGFPRASFAGFLNQTEVSRAYVAADCLVLASDHGETWGLVVNEALASGLPSIVSDACGCAEDLVGAEWTFPLGDIEALANSLKKFAVKKPVEISTVLPSVQDTLSTIVKTYAALET